MNTTTLQDFVAKAAHKNRITFGDVRRLQRDILPDGVSSREEAEALLHLDARVARADGTWTSWLVSSIVEFVVWGERPTGAVESEAAVWLRDLLAANGPPTKAARRIARETRREADRVEEPMASFVVEDDAPRAAEDDAPGAALAVCDALEPMPGPLQLAA